MSCLMIVNDKHLVLGLSRNSDAHGSLETVKNKQEGMEEMIGNDERVLLII